MVTEIEKRFAERQVIKKETRVPILIALALLASTVVYALISHYVKLDVEISKKSLEETTDAINLVVIVLVVLIMGVRRSIYFSPRYIDEDFNLEQVLKKWRSIDIFLMALAELIPLAGLALSLLGMGIDRTFHFFVAGGVLMLILMPLPLKVRGKISILRKSFPDI